MRLLCALLLSAGVVAAPSADFPRIDVSSYALTSGSTFDTYGQRIAALEEKLPPGGVADVLASANRTGRPLCHGTHLDADLDAQGFCWQSGEDDAENTWVPQGVTGSGDADPATGTIGGRRVVLATWHTPGDTFIRLSFVDVETLAYRHVLLVEPTSEENFAAIAGHGHGVTWRGDHVFVATTGGVIRVFDVRHIWATDTSSEEVGLGADGRYHARWHAFALPQIGAYWYPGGGTCTSVTGPRPCMATLSFDHTGDGSFLAAEHTAEGGGRILRWPFDPATMLPKTSSDGLVHAAEGFASPVWAMQGAVAHDGYFVLTGVCPENAGKPGDLPSCLHGGVGGESTHRISAAPVNSQNLAHWPATGELWLLGEQLRERVTVHVPWAAVTSP
jgi:hypothetical protein